MTARVTWGRCYDHNFRRCFSIFVEKMAFFLNTNVMINFFIKISFVLSQKCIFFRKNFWRKYLKNHNIGPRLGEFWSFGRFFISDSLFKLSKVAKKLRTHFYMHGHIHLLTLSKNWIWRHFGRFFRKMMAASVH
jgi:hypothetical protein